VDLPEVVRTVDRTLVDSADQIRLFHHLGPINEEEQRTRFFARRDRSWRPRFAYRPLEFSPDEILQILSEVPIQKIDDQSLRDLFADKRWEIERLVRLLLARGSADFLGHSLELFGRPPDDMVRDAQALLAEFRWDDQRDLDAPQVREMLERHIDSCRQRYPDFDCEVVFEDTMSSKMYVHHSRIHLRRGARFSRPAAQSDTFHEIDAHVLTYLNGRRQPLGLFQVGPRGTLAFQESLGVFTEIANGVVFPGRTIALAARVLAVGMMVDGAEFGDVFERLTEDNGLDDEEAFYICVRVFRGGGFTKDWVYVAELERIFRHWATGGEMGLLLLGKVTMDTLDPVRELAERGVLRPARYLPEYLDRISNARDDLAVQELLSQQRIALGDLLSITIG
jgi:uncharacterized protein (TIGR02421 family)